MASEVAEFERSRAARWMVLGATGICAGLAVYLAVIGVLEEHFPVFIPAASSALLALESARQLALANGLTITDDYVEQRGWLATRRIAWKDVARVDEKGFVLLLVGSTGTRVRVVTSYFSDHVAARRKLIALAGRAAA